METTWKDFDSAPKDREILVVFPNQGNVFLLIKWDNIHGYWVSKAEPKLGIENQGCKWTDIPAL